MRKKCVSCGLIAFATDEVCSRCGSDKLFKHAEPDKLPDKPKISSGKNFSFRNYAASFILACIIEFVALFPVLAHIGFGHSGAAAKTDSEIMSEFAVIILHLPTSAIFWLFKDFDEIFPLVLFAPVIQIIFWTFLISYFWRKSRNRLR